MNVPRWLNPATNPVLIPALASLAYAVWQAIQAAQAAGRLTWQQCVHIASGVVLAAALKYVVRARVTPLADPRDGNGAPLLSFSALKSLKAGLIDVAALNEPAEQAVNRSWGSAGEVKPAPPAGSAP